MPRHVVVSPEEDLASFYGGADPQQTTGASSPPLEPPLPVAPALVAPPPAETATVTVQRPLPPAPPPAAPPAQPAPPPAPIAPAPPSAPGSSSPDPALVAVISFFLPGVGQIMTGQVPKGAALLILFFVTCGLGGVLNVIAAADAWLIAQRRRRGETVSDWQFF